MLVKRDYEQLKLLFFFYNRQLWGKKCYPKKFLVVELHAYFFMQDVYLLSLPWWFVKDVISVGITKSLKLRE